MSGGRGRLSRMPACAWTISPTPPDRTASPAPPSASGACSARSSRRRSAPALRYPQHDPAAGRQHLPRDRRGARPPRVRQGAVRPGRARPLRPRRRLAGLGRRRRRHRRSSRTGSGARPPTATATAPTAPSCSWKQIGVNGLIADPQLPFFVEWDIPAELHPSHGADRRLLPGLPGDRRRPAAGQRVARRDRRGAARGRQGRVGGAPTAPPASSPRRSRRPTDWSGSDGHPPGARPSPNIWHHPATYEIENRAVDPDGRLEAAMAAIAAWAGRAVLDVGCGTGFHLPRFAATRRVGRRRRAAPRPGRAGPAPYPAAARTSPSARAWPRRCRCRTRRSTSCTPGGPTSSAPAASRAWPSSTASYAGAGPRS